MTAKRTDGFAVLLAGMALFLLLGLVYGRTSAFLMSDFKEIDYGARAALQQRDPYSATDVWNAYRSDAGTVPSKPSEVGPFQSIVALDTNLPTTLFTVIPFALLPFKAAAALWKLLIAASFLAACWLVWRAAASRTAGWVILLVLINSELIVFTGNPAGLVVGLTAIAAWCFIEGRWPWLGVVCFAIALSLKPHDAGPIWLYFLLAGGTHRRRALYAAALVGVLAVPAVLWLGHVSPHWLWELRGNLSMAMQRGGRDDPGPHGPAPGVGVIVSLQTLTSLLLDDPRFYNRLAYAICGVPLLLWCWRALRGNRPAGSAWVAIAAIAPLAMLPVYHRTYDAKLLLLTIPACALLWSVGGWRRWWALGLTLASLTATADLFWLTLVGVGVGVHALVAVRAVVPVCLFALGVFYLWIYVRDGEAEAGLATARMA